MCILDYSHDGNVMECVKGNIWQRVNSTGQRCHAGMLRYLLIYLSINELIYRTSLLFAMAEMKCQTIVTPWLLIRIFS